MKKKPGYFKFGARDAECARTMQSGLTICRYSSSFFLVRFCACYSTNIYVAATLVKDVAFFIAHFHLKFGAGALANTLRTAKTRGISLKKFAAVAEGAAPGSLLDEKAGNNGGQLLKQLESNNCVWV